MVVQGTESRNAQVEVLIFQVGTDTEAYLWQTAAQYHLVVGIDDTIVVDVLIQAVTDIGTWLVYMLTQCVDMIIQV